MKPIVLVDVDGVVANFCEAFLKATSYMLGKEFTEAAITTWDIGEALGLSAGEQIEVYRYLQREGIALSLKPYNGAIEGVKALAEVSEVYFVTSPLTGSRTWVHDRTEWLERYFGPKLARRAIHCNEKHLIRGDAFIDDKVENVDGWVLHNTISLVDSLFTKIPPAFLWDRSYNQEPTMHYRTNDWAHVIGLVSKM